MNWLTVRWGTLFARCLFLVVACTLPSAWAAPVVIDWKTIGGPDRFERQALTFDPVTVDSFVNFESSGGFRNLVGTQNSTIKAQIFLRVAGVWELFAENDKVRGVYLSEFSLADFVFNSIDFSLGPVSGVNFTNSGAGATEYFGMVDRVAGTRLTFSTATVPEPASLALVSMTAALLFASRAIATRRKGSGPSWSAFCRRCRLTRRAENR